MTQEEMQKEMQKQVSIIEHNLNEMRRIIQETEKLCQSL